MGDDRRSQLEKALQAHLDSAEFRGLDAERVWGLVSDILEGQAVELFYTAPLQEGGYQEVPRPAFQLVVCTPALIYDCVFGAATMRYDVSLLADVYRLKEQWSQEESVEGPPRKKLSVRIDFENYQGGLVLQLIAYGERAEELHRFARAVYQRTMAKGK